MEWASEGEHEEDEEASASEAGESEGTHESVGADGDEELPTAVPQASQEDDDDDPAKVEDDAASATEEEDREEVNERSVAALRIRSRQRRRLGGVSSRYGRSHVCLLVLL